MDNFLLVVFLYLLPTFVAFARECEARFAILTLNFTLGWTGIMWLVSLMLAVRNDEEAEPLPTSRCVRCNRILEAHFTQCNFCGQSMKLHRRKRYLDDTSVILSR